MDKENLDELKKKALEKEDGGKRLLELEKETQKDTKISEDEIRKAEQIRREAEKKKKEKESEPKVIGDAKEILGEDATGIVVENEKNDLDGIVGVPPEASESIREYLDTMEADFIESRDIRESVGAYVDPSTLAKEERNNMFKGIEVMEDEVDVDTDGRVKSDALKAEEGEKKSVETIDTLNNTKPKKPVTERKRRMVNSKELRTIKRKKPKDQMAALKQLRSIPNTTTIGQFTVALPISGYTATVSGCSPFEITTLVTDVEDYQNDFHQKWSLVHKKLVSTSIGDMTFAEFAQKTSYLELDTLLYGILCATFPSNDKIALSCGNPDCVDSEGNRTAYDHKYDNRTLLMMERLSEKGFESLDRLLKETGTIEGAKKVAEESMINTVVQVELPVSGYVVTMANRSVTEFIDEVAPIAQEAEGPRSQAAIISVFINSIDIPSDVYDEDAEYLTFTDYEAIVDIVYGLPKEDIIEVGEIVEESFNGNTFEFGVRDVKCPVCGHSDDHVQVPIDTLLFYHNQIE